MSEGNGNERVVNLTRDQILEAARTAKIEHEAMIVPELGGRIWVRGMSGKERDKTEEMFRIKRGPRVGQSDLRNFRAFMASRVIVNEAGDRILNDQDADMLGRLPAAVLDRIIAKMNDLSGTTDADADDLGNASASPAASDVSS